MSELMQTIFFVFGLVGLGYLSGRLGYLSTRVGEALTEFAVAVAVPTLLFRTMVQSDFSDIHPWSLWAVYFGGVVVAWALGQMIVTRAFGRDARAGVVAGLAASFSNLALLGTPVMLGLFGQQGFEVMTLILAVHLPVMMAASILLLAWAERDSGAESGPRVVAERFLRAFLTNPLIVGIIAGLAWRLTGLPIPMPADRIVDAIAGVAGPVALFSIGLGLVRFGIVGNVAPAAALGVVKLMVMPGVVFGLAWLAGLPPVSAQVAIVAAGLATGINPYLIATRFQTGQALASNALTLTTACAAVTTALWVGFAGLTFG